MKKIINGKLYNTETAKLICDHDNNCNRGDFQYRYVALYRKKTGEFFFYEETYNDKRIYIERDLPLLGLTRYNGSPLTEASEFVEEYGSIEDYENLWGKAEE